MENTTPAVKKADKKKRKKKRKYTGVCPGGENCPYPDILCTECELEIVD
jgi:hypothetical protein